MRAAIGITLFSLALFSFYTFQCKMLQLSDANQRCLTLTLCGMYRAETNTPKDEYDSYREYRVANSEYVFTNTLLES